MNKTIAALTPLLIRAMLPGFALTVLAACGGGSGGGGNAGGESTGGGGTAAMYSIGGTVSSLTGSGLVLHNGGDDLAVSAAGSFIFPTALAAGAPYAVTIKSQPSAPAQDCVVANGSGTVGAANVTNVTVSCSASTGPKTYTVGGSVSGLTGSGLMLANGSDTVSPAAGATSFVFATALTSGSSYAVTITTQPNGELCQVANGTGQIGSAAVTNVIVTCTTPVTYSIGGSISGLTMSGLVLANGTDTVSPAAGATSFTFPTALASGSSYAVTVQTQPQNEACQVAQGIGQVVNAAVTNVAVTCGRPWIWVSGSRGDNANGVYGTQGVAATGNVPGARYESVSWIDSTGDLWLFGGHGFDSTPARLGLPPPPRPEGDLNDLWRYSPSSRLWTWVSGSTKISDLGVYGTQGVAAAINRPHARSGSVSWIDSTGDLWLFGGYGRDNWEGSGYFNDLWRFSPGSGLWTWVSGPAWFNAQGVYGTQGVAAPGSVPGARYGSVSWIDNAGNLWLFGGYRFDFLTNRGLSFNDLWCYSPSSGLWTWISGSNSAGAPGVYGTQGVAAAANVPGARSGSVSWIDSAGDLWLFGGSGYNDLWRFSPNSGLWTWVSGSNTGGAPGVYGTQGVAAAGNVPGSRGDSVSWIDSAGNLWLFGGYGGDSTGSQGYLNDLWRYSPSSGLWTWISGSNTGGALGVYGAPALGNVPGARYGSVSWVDSAGDLWLAGGRDGSILSGLTAAPNVRNDLWRYNLATSP